MSICSPPTVPSSTWLASGSRSGGIFETRSSHTTGFYAWKSSEDQNDVIAGCVYNAPSAFPRVDVTVKVVSGASGSGLKQKLGPGDHCQAIVIKRHGADAIQFIVGAKGFDPITIDSGYVRPQPADIASLSWTPLVRTEEDVSWDQTSDPQPFGNGTENMDGRGGCIRGFPAFQCSPDGKHLAAMYAFHFDPPIDGDLMDPGQQQLSHARDISVGGSKEFCDQFSISYQQIVEPPSSKLAAYNGKHLIQIIDRCWSHPVFWSATVRRYRMIPALTPTSGDPVRFRTGEDIVFQVPQKTPASIRFSYSSGKIAILKPGESSADGKIKFARLASFGGSDFYIYRYSE
jgi:hypothetical protein